MSVRSLPSTLLCLVALALFLPECALATGAEMRPLGGAILLLAVGGVVLLQILTLLTEAVLPRRMPRGARWLIAIIAPILALAAGYVLLSLM